MLDNPFYFEFHGKSLQVVISGDPFDNDAYITLRVGQEEFLQCALAKIDFIKQVIEQIIDTN